MLSLPHRTLGCVLFCLLALSLRAALGDASLLLDAPAPGSVALAGRDATATLLVADSDWPGVIRAAGDLQADIERVTGRKPALATATPTKSTAAVLIGTVGKSALIDGLVAAGKLNVDAIRGKWEAFVI